MNNLGHDRILLQNNYLGFIPEPLLTSCGLLFLVEDTVKTI